MSYKELKTVFHSNPNGKSAQESELSARLNGPSTITWDFPIGDYQLFAVITAELLAMIEQVWRNELLLQQKWNNLPSAAQQQYILGLLVTELQATNAIEDIQSTHREIADALSAASSDSAKRFKQMADQYRTLTDPNSILQPFPTSPQEVRSIYDALLGDEIDQDDAPDGELFRQGPVHVSDYSRTIHSGIADESAITRLLKVLIADQNESDSHLLVRALMSHFMFEYIHPFYDGNGRLGRFLLSKRLKSLLSLPTAISLSHVFSTELSKYYKAFKSVEEPLNCGEGSFFLKAMLKMLLTAQEDLLSSLEKKNANLTALCDRLTSFSEHSIYDDPVIRTLAVLGQAHLFGPATGLPLDDLAHYLNVSTKTARKRTKKLEELGLATTLQIRPIRFALTRKGQANFGLI